MKALKYFGSKLGDLEFLFQILPKSKLKKYIEACMGSGIWLQTMRDAGNERIGIEKDFGVYTLNCIMRDRPYELFEQIKHFEYSESEYMEAKQIVELAMKGVCDYSDMEVAVAEYKIILMSYNNTRGRYRKVGAWKECTDQVSREKKRINERCLINGIYRDWQQLYFESSERLQGVKIIHGDFMGDKKYWKEQDNLIFADVPYMYVKRGINGERKETGYLVDWSDAEHIRFLDFIEKLYAEGELKAKVIICSNFTVDNQGELLGIREDIYVQRLLPLGFRLVVLNKKFATDIKSERTRNEHKTEKREVVFINYREILGDWTQLQYYDYDDVFAEK